MGWGLLLLLAAGIIVGVALGDTGTLGGLSGSAIASLVGSVALLIFLFRGGAKRFGGISKGVHDLAIWAIFMLVLIAGYAYRDDAKRIYNRIAGELLPPGHTLSVADDRGANRAVRIRRQPGGHFVVRATVNGQDMTMLVDTGASSIVLTPTDARKAGINIASLRYTVPVRTANGLAYAAATQVSSIAVGTIVMHNLNVMVGKPGTLSESLLGMNFLTRLRSYEFSGDFLTLRG